MKKYLIINADDCGSCFAANEAVEHLFDHGAITSATLMVPCPWAEDAIQRAKRNPRIKLGLHTTLTCEYEKYKWGPISRDCTSLMNSQGYFYATADECLQHAKEDEVRRELYAQFDWMKRRGVMPEHIDNHMATAYGEFLPIAYQMCVQYHLNFRLPRIPETFSPDADEIQKAPFRQAAAEAERLGIGLPDGLFTCGADVAASDTYEQFRGYYMDILRRCPEGISELFVHPCIETEELKYFNPQWVKRVWEYRVLLDPVFRACIEENSIQLCTYSDAPFYCLPFNKADAFC